jgi:hypothetical protein
MESLFTVKAKIQRIKRLINISDMPCCASPSNGKGISKLFVPLGIKNPKVAARFTNLDGNILPEEIFAMAQSD